MSFEFGDVVLVSSPFTDQMTSKKRPAVVVSSNEYQLHRSDLVLMAVTLTSGHRNSSGKSSSTSGRKPAW